MKNIVIIGAGASGLTAAICAAERCHVTVLEQFPKAGRKLLATGNGRCNFLNEDQAFSHFHSQDTECMEKTLSCISKQEILDFFRSLGILPKSRNGYLYPLSGQASSVQSALLRNALMKNVEFHFEETALDIQKKGENFTVKTNRAAYQADSVILAVGSKAGIKAKDYVGGYELAKRVGHSIRPVLPALVQLKSDAKICRYWAGIRTEASVSLYIDDIFVKQDIGELMLTDYGISGIVVFQVSGEAAIALNEGKEVHLLLDFLPNMTGNELWAFLDEISSAHQEVAVSDMLSGILPVKLAQSLVMEACKRYREVFSARAEELRWMKLKPLQKERLLRMLKEFTCSVIGTNGYEQAQVCSGGVPLTEIYSDTCESKLIKGLYLTGELLDVNGDCGGYNLQWAWTTGMLAGRSVGRT